MRLRGDGSWALRKSTGGTVTTLSSGTITGYNNANWHNVKIAANGTTITGYVDGGTFNNCNGRYILIRECRYSNRHDQHHHMAECHV